MKISKTIKKIAALGTGLSMVGATMLSAMAAADLATYPAPFVKDGVFDALIVVGESAATQDVLGAIDIATSLQYSSKTTSSVATGTAATISLSGENKKIEKSSNKLEINETASGITSSVTKSDLATALADGSINNEHGTFDYTQTLYLPTLGRIEYTMDPDDDDNMAKPYFLIPSGATVYRYKLTFTPALKSDHSTASPGNFLEDIRNKKINLLGQEYTILKANHPAGNQTTLTLMGGAVSDILEEGASKTYTIGGKDYDVSLDFVSTSETKFTVNGEATNALQEGDTFTLADDTELGVVDILAQEFAGGLRKVDFSLGANKIKIDDSNTGNQTWGATVTIGKEDMSQVKADIVVSVDGGTVHGSDVSISSIEVNYTAGSDLYLEAGKLASEVADDKENQKGNFFTNGFDYKFEGLQIGKTEDIKFVPSGSNNVKVEFTNKNGVKYNEDIFGRTASGTYNLGRYTGSEMRKLATNETDNIEKNHYFVVSKNEYSRIMQFKSVTPGSSTTDSAGTVTVKDLGSGDSIDISYASLTGSLQLDGNTYRVNLSADGTSATLNIDFNGDGDLSDFALPELWTQYGANITLTPSNQTDGAGDGGNSSAGSIVITTETDEDDAKDVVAINLTESGDGKIDITDNFKVTGTTGKYTMSWSPRQAEDGSYKYSWYTTYGVFVEVDRKGSGNTQNDFNLVYPDEQAYGALFVTSGITSASKSTGAGTVETTSVTRIDVGAAVLDTDPAVEGREKQNNLIVVGSAAINKAAASLLGLPFPTYGYTGKLGVPENAAIIKLIEHSDGKAALLVMGWEADDTQRASRVVADYAKYQKEGTLKGTEVEVTGSSLTDITVSAPSVVTAAATTTE
ncbi:MAG TPA: S-layer protein [Candidatus Nanoarchaeia archaeon]|nr:S-layer protein [Candidatus Nanoarchaeia archaeon]